MTRNIKPKIALEPNPALPPIPEYKPSRWFFDLWFALFLLGYGCCLYTKITWQPKHYQTVDGKYYEQLADKIRAGKPFVVDGLVNRKQLAFSPYPPGYPVLLALGKSISGFPYEQVAIWLNLILIGMLALFWRHFAPLWVLAVGLCIDSILELSCYTWSEFPFIICLIFIGLISSRISFHLQQKWLFLIFLMAAFLLRFASVFFLLFLGVMVIVSWKRGTKNEMKTLTNLDKRTGTWVWLFLSFSAFVLAYFGLEWLFYGQPTGGDRYPNLESNLQLFHALGLELFNQLSLFKDLTGSSSASLFLGLSFQLFFLGWILSTKKRKMNRIENQSLSRHFIAIGLCYLIFIVSVRWYFYLAEPFDFRLMSPGGVLLFIGLMIWFSNNYTFRRPKMLLFIFLVLSLFFSLPKKEMILDYQQWFWLENVKLHN